MNNILKNFLVPVFLVFFAFGLFGPISGIQAVGIVTEAPKTDMLTQAQTTLSKGWEAAKSAAVTFYNEQLPKTISNVYGQVLKTALTKMASDSAKWIGSGGKGQKPMFLTSNSGKYLKDIGDSITGSLIESTAKQLVSNATAGKIGNFSFCNPGNFDVAVKIGLGLRATEETSLPTCTFTKIRSNVESFASSQNFMGTLQNMFEPTSNDVSLALSLNSNSVDLVEEAKKNAAADKASGGGWLNQENSIGLGGDSKFLGFNILNEKSAGWKANNTRDMANNASMAQTAKQAGDDAYTNCMKSVVGPLLPAAVAAKTAECESIKTAAITNSYSDSVNSDAGKVYSDCMDKAGSSYEKCSADESKRFNELTKGLETSGNQIASTPDSAKNILADSQNNLSNRMLSTTGQALVDAANVFLNQLALTAFQETMKSLGKKNNPSESSFSYDKSFWSSLTDKNAPAYNPGEAGVIAKLQKTVMAQYSTKADYDILTELSICPNPQKAGPTECVIDDKFRQAIQDKKTVGAAVKDGTISGDLVFGWQDAQTEPKYTDGYPYRSMLILRKYRILPVGWEIAAQKIHENWGTAVGVSKPVTLKYMLDCFSLTDDYGEPNAQANWCVGLVDPNWLLKSTKSYCGKVGVGPIINQTVDNSGEVSVTRKSDYCADEQSCIKERDDGSCELYGYCTEDRRSWSFGDSAKSCEPIDNTCQAYRDASTGSDIAYLKNTLDYSNCDASVSGCMGYCRASSTGDYFYDSVNNKLTFNCAASSNSRLFFDDSAKTCDASAEGCTKLLRAGEGLGANLLTNSDFEDVNASGVMQGGWSAYGATSSDAFAGKNSLNLAVGNRDQTLTVGYNARNSAFSLSAMTKDCGVNDKVTIETLNTLPANSGKGGSVSLVLGSASSSVIWNGVNLSHYFDNSSQQTGLNSEIVLHWAIISATCKVDNIKLERGLGASGYSAWGEKAVVYEKVAPNYLTCTGASTDSVACQNYARKCQEFEVGCDLFTSQTNGTQIPGKVNAKNYCYMECVGYKEYMQSETSFETRKPQQLIAKSAKQCLPEDLGCDEFTNLDKLVKGGESVEYYTNLRQCLKTSDPVNEPQCSSYFVWNGSGAAGYQLSSVILKTGAGISGPAVTSPDNLKCNAAIFNLPSTDPSYNPDCREFYDKNGDKSYHLYTRTISCSDDCHPYRRSEVDVLWGVSQASCAAPASWDADQGECQVCSNGGTLSTTTPKTCIYNAIPSEGKVCQAAAKGCREYAGSAGQNMQIVSSDDFESGTGGWMNNNAAITATLDNNSLRQNGKSIKVSQNNKAVYKKLDGLVAGKTYVVDFLAQGDDGVTVYFHHSLSSWTAADTLATAHLSTKNSWTQLKTTLTIPSDYKDLNDLYLFVVGDNNQPSPVGDFYLDDIRITEITDRYYFLKNSWQTPDSCDQDLWGSPELYGMLNCDQYQDRNGVTRYLKSFDQLCQDSGVGCEIMIDTHNSSSTYATVTNGVTTPADSFAYVVYDKTKQCGVAQKGCERFGKMEVYNDTKVNFFDSYILNNPDSYDTATCGAVNVGCQAFAGNGSTDYFKDPKSNVCEFRTSSSSSAGKWYKRKIKYCGGKQNNNTCSTNDDCTNEALAADKICTLLNLDVDCPVDASKTIGQGLPVYQPRASTTVKWAGVCDVDASGCSELIDPASKPSANLLANPKLADLDGNTTKADGWDFASSIYTRGITLSNNTLYTLGASGKGSGLTVELDCGNNNLSFINPLNNNLDNLSNEATAVVLLDEEENVQVKTGAGASSCTVAVVVDNISNFDGEIFVKKSLISYNKVTDLDKKSCNGLVNFSNGCILFNQRGVIATSSVFVNQFDPLTFDADKNYYDNLDRKTYDVAGSNNANTIIKVEPDRKCNKWLTCKSKVGYTDENGSEKNYCTSLAMCDQINSDGSCAHVAKKETNMQIGDGGNAGSFLNYTGYSKVGLDGAKDIQSTGFFAIDNMDQAGGSISIPNGDFEIYGEDTSDGEGKSSYKPSSWRLLGGEKWTSAKFDVVRDAVTAQIDQVRYPLNNAALMRIGASTMVMSSGIQIASRGDYYLTFSINTKKLELGKVKVEVVNGSALNATVYGSVEIDNGSDWSKRWIKFDALGNVVPAQTIYIRISTIQGAVGKYHLDNFSIKPVLGITKTNTAAPDKFNRTPECRLFAKDDSLSCEYREKSGLKVKGLYGFCLEYDRYPGNPNSCLLWWPVDRMLGDSEVDESSDLSNLGPLYYCAEAKPFVPVVLMQRKSDSFTFKTGYHERCLANQASTTQWCQDHGLMGYVTDFTVTNWGRDGRMTWSGWKSHEDCVAQITCLANGIFVKDETPLNTTNAWFLLSDGVPNEVTLDNNACPVGSHSCSLTAAAPLKVPQDSNPMESRLRFYDTRTQTVDDKYLERMARCEKISQLVTESGENKAWSNRVGASSHYMVGQGESNPNARLYYSYTTKVKPFGSMFTPLSIDPFGWNGSEGDDDEKSKGPIFVKNFVDPANKTKIVNGGAPYQLVDTSYTGTVVAGTPFQSTTTLVWNSCVAAGTPADPDGSIYETDTPTMSDFDINNASVPAAFSIGVIDVNKVGGLLLRNCTETVLPQGNSPAADCYCGPIATGTAIQITNSGKVMLRPHSTTVIVNQVATTTGPKTVDISTKFGRCVTTKSLKLGNLSTTTCSTCAGGTQYKTWEMALTPTSDYFQPEVSGTMEICMNINADAAINVPNQTLKIASQFKCGGGELCVPFPMATDWRSALKSIYVANYETYYFDWSTYNYELSTFPQDRWSAPTVSCAPGTATDDSRPFCGFNPRIANLTANNGVADDYTIKKSGFANLTFNTVIDTEQRPLSSLEVTWGDGTVDKLLNASISDRPDPLHPHSFSHLFDYWALKATVPGNCSGTCCTLTPTVKVKDNWGFCIDGSESVGGCVASIATPYKIKVCEQ